MPWKLCAMAVLSLGLGFAACSSEGETPPQKARKADPLLSFQDELGVTERYSASNRDLAALAAKGSQLVLDLGCAVCHQPMGVAETGPKLGGVGNRYTRVFGDATKARVWMHHKVLNSAKYKGRQSQYYPSTSMVDFSKDPRFTPDALEAIVEHLFSLKDGWR